MTAKVLRNPALRTKFKVGDVVHIPRSVWPRLTNKMINLPRVEQVVTEVGDRIIEHGKNGFLADKSDVNAFVAYTRKLIEDPALRAQMGQTGRRMVEEHFTDKPVRDLEAVYARLTGCALKTIR